MTRRVLLLLLVIAIGAPSVVFAAPDKAMCIVCALLGETKEEKVKAETTLDGNTYYFCSEKCKKAFDAEPAAYMEPVLPRPAPAFVVETLDGTDQTLADHAGKVLLLDFWATWCKPCEKIMPDLQALHDEFGGNGFDILGVSIDEAEDRVERIRKFVKKKKISYPILLDAKAEPAWHDYHVKVIPSLFLVNESGQIVAQWRGTIDHDAVRSAVVELLGS